MKKIWTIISIFLFGILPFSLAQNKIDSLRNSLTKASDGIDKVDLQNKLALELKGINLNESFHLSKMALSQAISIGYSKGAGMAQSNLGLFYYLINRFDSATYYNQKAINPLLSSGDSIEISKNYNRLGVDYYVSGKNKEAAEQYLLAISWSNNGRLKANAYNNLGMISKNNGDYGQAIQYHAQALSLYELLEDKLYQSHTYCNLGSCYISKKNWKAAAENYTMAEALGKEVNDNDCIAQSLNGLGIVASKRNENDKAILYFQESAKRYLQLNAHKEYAQQLVNLGDMYTKLKNYSTAIDYYNKSVDWFKILNDKQNLAAVYNNLGNLFNQQNNSKSAVVYFEKALELAAYSNEQNFKVIIAKNLSSIHESMGNSEKALKYRKLYDTYKEEVISVAENVKFLEIDKSLEVSKKEKQLAMQDQKINAMETSRIWLYVVLSMLLITAVFLYVLNQKRIKKQRTLEQNILSISNQIESLKSENHNLRDELLLTAKELSSLNQKYTGNKEKLPDGLTPLSKREFEVLLFIAEGLTDKEISEKIFVSINTVRTHTRRIYDKLLVNNRLEAAALLNKFQLTDE